MHTSSGDESHLTKTETFYKEMGHVISTSWRRPPFMTRAVTSLGPTPHGSRMASGSHLVVVPCSSHRDSQRFKIYG